jgi:hypothetical protein
MNDKINSETLFKQIENLRNYFTKERVKVLNISNLEYLSKIPQGLLVGFISGRNGLGVDNLIKIEYVLSDYGYKPINVKLTIRDIQKLTCEYFGITKQEMDNPTRKRETVQARQITMYFCKQLTNKSFEKIGMEIGDKDHATVLHACKTVSNLIETNKEFKFQVEEIEKKLRHVS